MVFSEDLDETMLSIRGKVCNNFFDISEITCTASTVDKLKIRWLQLPACQSRSLTGPRGFRVV